MEKIFTAIIGGGASGLFLATALSPKHGKIVVFERGDRVGRKLSATGNGQGNLTNTGVTDGGYFSVSQKTQERIAQIIAKYDNTALQSHMERLGVLVSADSRGRVYPVGRQASAITDALRYYAAEQGVELRTGARVVRLEKCDGAFVVTTETGERALAEKVVLCTGGKAAKNFGTDGSAYALAEGFGHTVTPLYPSLVQLKTDTAYIKTLKGIRAADISLTARYTGGEKTLTGDVIFTDYGVSGDAVFRVSAFLADKLVGAKLYLDFLPDFSKARILSLLKAKAESFPSLPKGELLCGVVNNQIGRAVLKRAENSLERAVELVKAFPLEVKGSLGFDYAQVTKGGVPLLETDGHLQSKLVEGLYFAGEILDADGECGGYNLQWAFSSARIVAEEIEKARGQV